MDIAFLLDSSGSIGERSYQKMKDFVKKVADAFVIGPSTTCAGVIIFGSSATTAVRFADATNNTVFNAAVDALPYMRGETRIDKALQLASAELLNHPSGARVGVAKVVIVLTDGGQSKAPYAMNIQKAVAPLLSAGIRIFAVGIGKDVDDRHLRLMVDDKDDAIMVPSFDGLSVHSRQLSIATCESSGKHVTLVSFPARSVGVAQCSSSPREGGEHCMTPARTAAKETGHICTKNSLLRVSL